MHMHVSADACMAGNNTSNGVAAVIAAAASSDSPLCHSLGRASTNRVKLSTAGAQSARCTKTRPPVYPVNLENMCRSRASPRGKEHGEGARGARNHVRPAAAQKVFAVAVASRHNHPAPAPAPRSIRKFPIAPPLPFLQPTQQHCFLLCDAREMRDSASTPGLDRLISAD